jgi:hypothetical protein
MIQFPFIEMVEVKNMVKKVYLTKLPLALFVFVLISATIGAATAATNPNTQLPDAYVVQSGKGFSGPTAIQDSIDSSSTLDNYKVYLQPGNYSQQVTVSKNIRIKGMGTNPEDTTIEVNTDGYGITVPDGVTLTLENIAITNTGTGRALSDTGMINLINCIITENYVETTPEGTLELNTLASGTTETTTTDSTTEIDSEGGIESTDLTDSYTLTTENPTAQLASEETTTTNTSGTDNTPESPTPLEDGIPLTTMAYGMLMVVGGVVLPHKPN